MCLYMCAHIHSHNIYTYTQTYTYTHTYTHHTGLTLHFKSCCNYRCDICLVFFCIFNALYLNVWGLEGWFCSQEWLLLFYRNQSSVSSIHSGHLTTACNSQCQGSDVFSFCGYLHTDSIPLYIGTIHRTKKSNSFSEEIN